MQIKFAFALGLFVSLYIIVLHLPQLTLKINVYVFFQRISGICPQGQRNGHGCRRNHRRCVRKNRFIASQRHPDAAHRRPHRQYGLLVAAARHQQGARPLLESDTRSDRRNRVGYGGECSCGTDLVELRRIHPTVRGFRYPGLLRLSDGQDDEQADEEKTGSRAGTGAGTVQGGVVAYGDSGPAPGTKKNNPSESGSHAQSPTPIKSRTFCCAYKSE